MVTLTSEDPADLSAIDDLLDLAFGPGRYAKTAYRFREGVAPIRALCLVARGGGGLCGSLRFWPIQIGESRGLLLGPLAVDPALRGRGIGIGLMIMGLARARCAGFPWVMLVGDEPYYARVGFQRTPPGRFCFPGPVDPDRLLARALMPASLDGLSGAVRPDRDQGPGIGSAAFAIPGEAEEQGDAEKRGKRGKKRAL
jgi:predicted N-acetyltransferase YhbS